MSLRRALATKQSRSNSRKTIKIALPEPALSEANVARNGTTRIGLFGGTFNPIHIGHIKMAETARKQFKLDYVYFIPCGVPPHRTKDLYPAKLRYKLVKNAIKGNKYFKVLDVEIKKKKKPSYTLDTILLLRGALATKQSRANSRKTIGIALPSACNEIELYFLIGADEFNKLKNWYKYQELVKLVTFIVLPRREKIKVPRIKRLKWKSLRTRRIDISSTEIRKALSNIRLAFNSLT